MYTIRTLNNIAKTGLAKLPEQNFVIDEKAENPEGIILRSFDMHKMELNENLLAVARAGAGTNNIPIEKCTQKGVPVFNTPGANANAVKELVLAGLFASSRRIIAGAAWVQGLKDNCESVEKAVEAGKKEFTGPEIAGKTLGVIGLGAIGVKVANTAVSLGMEVYGYDPYVSVNAAWNLSRSVKHVMNVEEIYADCDYITIHVPLLDSTKKMINKEAFDKMKDGVVLLNFARDLLVDDDALIEALDSGKVKKYVTDFANHTVAGHKGILVTPHLGASTEESEENCAVMAVKEVRDFLENGNIKNSVNFPNAIMNATGTKVCILHKNVPTIIAQITSAVGEAGLNIDNMVNASKKDYAYTMLDIAGDVTDAVADKMSSVDGIIKVRVIK